ncbi:hypothetical protein AMTR_s00163p00055330 [Amborella trichopoda]|uniref:Retroviral polymerase SH3-like domain-containing protein n=1 Tax=Amborella trichopoda TaxID=13333 RepID=W1PPE3_AMBTC|nr:hypothetical protein AMTR_s00163p00055330 [Amborella trichopoda]
MVWCIFGGYDTEMKGWRCCDPTTERCYTSWDVVFDEVSPWWTLEIVKVSDTGDKQRPKTDETLEGEHDEPNQKNEM